MERGKKTLSVDSVQICRGLHALRDPETTGIELLIVHMVIMTKMNSHSI